MRRISVNDSEKPQAKNLGAYPKLRKHSFILIAYYQLPTSYHSASPLLCVHAAAFLDFLQRALSLDVLFLSGHEHAVGPVRDDLCAEEWYGREMR